MFLLPHFLYCCHLQKFTVNGEKIEGCIIYQSTTCTIVQIKDTCNAKNPFLYWVLAQVASEVAVEAGKAICIQLAGEENQYICEAVADGVSLLSGLKGIGKTVEKTIAKGTIKYWAEKKVPSKSLNFLIHTYEIASDVKNVVEAYDNLGIVNWQNASWGSNNATYNNGDVYYGNINLKNDTQKTLNFEISHDGVKWTSYSLMSGYSSPYYFWNGTSKQPYGFIRVNGCIFQMNGGKTYRILYNPNRNEYEMKLKL